MCSFSFLYLLVFSTFTYDRKFVMCTRTLIKVHKAKCRACGSYRLCIRFRANNSYFEYLMEISMMFVIHIVVTVVTAFKQHSINPLRFRLCGSLNFD